MKTAIVYYSFDGNCALVAETLRDILSAQGAVRVFEIKTLDTQKRRGLSKYLWGGAQVWMGKKPGIQRFDFDAAVYDLIVLGAPVWAASPAPPLAAFLDTAGIRGKRVGLFCCHAGGKGKAPEKFKALVRENTVAGFIDLRNPASRPQGLRETLRAWAEGL